MKKVMAFLLSGLMSLSVCTTGFAAVPGDAVKEPANAGVNVYSPEYPNAYIITERTGDSNGLTRSGENRIEGVTATVFVEENYNYDNGKRVVTESRLLSQAEVEAIGVENFDNFDTNNLTRSAGASRGKLKITIDGSYTEPSGGINVKIKGNAAWSGFNTIYNSTDNPAVGKDFFGLAWSGGYTASGSSCSATWNTGGSPTVYLSEAAPNAGRIYEFTEFADAGGKYMIYVNNADLSTTLSKNVQTGGGNRAEIVLKYIHTYQATTGSISISASASGVGAGFSLSNTPKQWSISCVATAPY